VPPTTTPQASQPSSPTIPKSLSMSITVASNQHARSHHNFARLFFRGVLGSRSDRSSRVVRLYIPQFTGQKGSTTCMQLEETPRGKERQNKKSSSAESRALAWKTRKDRRRHEDGLEGRREITANRLSYPMRRKIGLSRLGYLSCGCLTVLYFVVLRLLSTLEITHVRFKGCRSRVRKTCRC
jgi:hypothetical protein